MKFEIEIDCFPEGYEPVRFGAPKKGDTYIGEDNNLITNSCGMTLERLILRKKWQPPANAAKGLKFYPNYGMWFVTSVSVKESEIPQSFQSTPTQFLKAKDVFADWVDPPEQKVYST